MLLIIFDARKIALYSDEKIAELLDNSQIVRNRLKINSTITNAKAFLKIQQRYGSFDQFIWQFVNHQTKHNNWKTHDEIPSSTVESVAMSKSLQQLGFKFIGKTICYAFMQATGMVNDHTVNCQRYQHLKSQFS